jgi:hypothetical protein
MGVTKCTKTVEAMRYTCDSCHTVLGECVIDERTGECGEIGQFSIDIFIAGQHREYEGHLCQECAALMNAEIHNLLLDLKKRYKIKEKQ